MSQVSELRTRLFAIAPDKHPHVERIAEEMICSYAMDICKMVKNINETSIGFADKKERINRLASETGMSLYELSKLI